MPCPAIVNSGVVSRMIQVRDSSSTMRVTIARARPRRRAAPLRSGQPPDEDRDEDDVVDAEDDLERGEGDQRDPGLGVE